jgi:anti-anti-sigma factor
MRRSLGNHWVAKLSPSVHGGRIQVKISIRRENDVVVLSLNGNFAAGTDGPLLRNKTQELFDAGARKMVVDFAGVPYIDSTGLGFLASSRAAADKAQARLVLCGVEPQVKQILDRVQMSQFFSIADDQADALALLAAPVEMDSAGGSPVLEPRKGRKLPPSSSRS